MAKKTYTDTELRNLMAEKMEEQRELIKKQEEHSPSWYFHLGKKDAYETLLMKF